MYWMHLQLFDESGVLCVLQMVVHKIIKMLKA